jgi:hypothetical protein
MLLASEARRIAETGINDDLSWLDEEIYAACKDGVTTITFTCLPEAIEEIERCGYTIKDRLRLTNGFDLITIEW